MKTLTGAEFKYTVHKARLTVSAVVKEAGIPWVGGVSRWINGHTGITLATYDKLIAAYEKLKEED